jgi:hypothetical protein
VTDALVTSVCVRAATLARVFDVKLHPIDGDAASESPSRDSRKTAACTRFDERFRR